MVKSIIRRELAFYVKPLEIMSYYELLRILEDKVVGYLRAIHSIFIARAVIDKHMDSPPYSKVSCLL